MHIQLLLALTILVVISSLISISSLGINLIKVENSDKYAHVFSYFVLSTLELVLCKPA